MNYTLERVARSAERFIAVLNQYEMHDRQILAERHRRQVACALAQEVRLQAIDSASEPFREPVACALLDEQTAFYTQAQIDIMLQTLVDWADRALNRTLDHGALVQMHAVLTRTP